MARRESLKGNGVPFPVKGSPMYFTQYLDHTYCGVEQQRPRITFSDADPLRCTMVEITLYASLRAQFPTKPFYPFRHHKTFLMSSNDHYRLKPASIAFYGLDYVVGQLDPRITARLSLAHHCLKKQTAEDSPLITHFLYEFIYQHFPAIINVFQKIGRAHV